MASTQHLDDMRADWRAEDLRVLAKVDALSARTADVLTTPGLAAPNVELARVVQGLLGLIRDHLAPQAPVRHPSRTGRTT